MATFGGGEEVAPRKKDAGTSMKVDAGTSMREPQSSAMETGTSKFLTTDPRYTKNFFPDCAPDNKTRKFLLSFTKGPEQITPDNLKEMKFFLVGRQGIKLSELQECDSALELFMLMMEKRMLSCHNLLHLQYLLHVVDRNDLSEKVVDYAKASKTDEPIYYEDVPASEDTHVKVRVHGNARRFDNNGAMAKIIGGFMDIEERTVEIMSLKESKGIELTLIIPKYAAERLKTNNAWLSKINADRFTVDGEKFIVQEQPPSEAGTSEGKK